MSHTSNTDVLAALADFQQQAEAGRFPLQDAPAWYAAVQQLRNLSDYYERALIRHLKYERGLTWQQVAEVVAANLSSKQAAHRKWTRLIDDERRAAGTPGWGGRRQSPTVSD